MNQEVKRRRKTVLILASRYSLIPYSFESSPFRSLPFTLRKEGVNINPRESPKTNRQLEKKRLNRRGITQANSRQGRS